MIGPSLVRVTHDLAMPLYLATYGAIFILHIIVFTIMSFIGFPSVATSTAAASQTDIGARRVRCGRSRANRASSRQR